MRAIRKYKFKEDACLNLLFRRTRYHYKFGEVAVRLGIESATIQKHLSTPLEEKDRVDRRIFAPHLQRIEVEEEDWIALLQLPKE